MTPEEALLQSLGRYQKVTYETPQGTTIVLHGIRIFIPANTPPEFIHEASLFLERVYLQESADCGGS